MTSERPCGPELVIASAVDGRAIASPVPSSTSAGIVSTTTTAHVTSRRPRRLPRYSGVRPTMSPARKTATIATTRIE